MNELRPHGRQLLENARLASTPSSLDRHRVLSALATPSQRPSMLARLQDADDEPRLRGLPRILLLLGVALLVAGVVYLASHAGR